jgi:hypothetical protein
MNETFRYDLECSIWDAYKELNGIRPRHLKMAEMSIQELESYLDNLYQDLRDEQEYNAHEDFLTVEAEKVYNLYHSNPLPWEVEAIHYEGL